jgi:hypothetical protein
MHALIAEVLQLVLAVSTLYLERNRDEIGKNGAMTAVRRRALGAFCKMTAKRRGYIHIYFLFKGTVA